jgi:ribonuclease HI
MITVYFDGACEPTNPGGVATYGYIIYKNNECIKQGYGVVGEGSGMTNNVAEYTALLEALQWIKSNNMDKFFIDAKGDSMLVINQVNGAWSIKSNTSKQFVQQIKDLIKGKDIKLSWVPREQNKEADRLSRFAYKKYKNGEPLHNQEFTDVALCTKTEKESTVLVHDESNIIKLVYIAGPYTGATKDIVKQNIKKSEDLAKEVILLGFIPIIPHKITSFFDLDGRFSGWTTDDWINKFCIPLMDKCDALLLADGWNMSRGCIIERAYATKINIPVFYSLNELTNYVGCTHQRVDCQNQTTIKGGCKCKELR